MKFNLIDLDDEQLGNAEVTNDNQVTAADASTIGMYVAGLIPSLPWGNFPQAAGTPVMNDLNSQYGQQVEVPVYITSRDDLYSLEGKLEYDASVFNYTGLQLHPAFANSLKEVRNADGTVSFAVASVNEVEFPADEPVMKLILNYTGMGHNNTSEVSLTTLRINENIHLTNAASSTIHIVTGIDDDSAMPDEFILSQNFPNPFNPSTLIRYALPKESKVSIGLYSPEGGLIREVLNTGASAGYHNVTLDMSGYTSGVYFYKIIAIPVDGSAPFTATRKLVLLK